MNDHDSPSSGRHPLLIVGLTAAITLSGATPLPAQDAPPETASDVALEARVDSVFADLDAPDRPGCALSVMERGAAVYRRGYGMANLEYGIPITPASVFHVASVSKQFTTMALALLVDEGRVSWDDDIRDYVPEVPDLGERITLRHLVHHTSGIRDQWELLIMAGWRWEADLVTQEDVLDIIARQTALNFRPGDEYLYSNTGFTLLAAVVERVSGRSLREFTRERIFDPLGMDDTHFHDDHQMIVEDRAYGYAPEGDGWKISIPDFAIVGASSLFTTVEDLARWDRNFYTGRVGGRRVVDAMATRGTLNDGEPIDYARALVHGEHRGLPTLGHGGADAGYRSAFLRYPDQDFAVAVLCNDPASGPGRRARRVAEVYLEDRFPEPPERSSDGTDASDDGTGGGALDRSSLTALEGWYRDPDTDRSFRIRLTEDGLRADRGTGNGLALTPIDNARFRLGDSEDILTIEERNGDRPVRLRIPRGIGSVTLRRAAPADTSAEHLSGFVGMYQSDELGTEYSIELDDDGLAFRHRKHGRMSLTPTHRDAFTFYFDFMGIRFHRNEDGQVTGFTMSSPRVRKVRFVKTGDR